MKHVRNFRTVLSKKVTLLWRYFLFFLFLFFNNFDEVNSCETRKKKNEEMSIWKIRRFRFYGESASTCQRMPHKLNGGKPKRFIYTPSELADRGCHWSRDSAPIFIFVPNKSQRFIKIARPFQFPIEFRVWYSEILESLTEQLD